MNLTCIKHTPIAMLHPLHFFTRAKIMMPLLTWLMVSCCSQKDQKEMVIYITNEGNRYHESDCRYLGKSALAISLKEALKKGYEPCSECITTNKPTKSIKKMPIQQQATKWRCSAITKAGKQCKRYTKNPQKKCFQHDN